MAVTVAVAIAIDRRAVVVDSVVVPADPSGFAVVAVVKVAMVVVAIAVGTMVVVDLVFHMIAAVAAIGLVALEVHCSVRVGNHTVIVAVVHIAVPTAAVYWVDAVGIVAEAIEWIARTDYSYYPLLSSPLNVKHSAKKKYTIRPTHYWRW
jgi:hypothetical protein